MKKYLKLMLAFLTVGLLIALLAFTVSADDSSTAGSFTVTYGSKTVNGVGYAALKNAVTTANSSSAKEIRITLHGDMLDVSSALAFKTGKTYYFDLAGNKYANNGKISNYLFSTAASSTINMYSSKPGGAVFHAYSGDGTTSKGHLLFPLNYNNLTINLGEATVDGVTHDGDNISFYCSGIVDNSSGNETTNTVLNIKGGSYFRTSGGSYALFIVRSNAQINIEDAFLYSNSTVFTFMYALTDNLDANGNAIPCPSNGKIFVNNSTVYCTDSSGMINMLPSDATLHFSDCYIIGHVKNANTKLPESVGKQDGAATFERCILNATATFKTDKEIVKANEYKEIKYNINHFKFYLYSSTEKSDGTIDYDYRLDAASFELEPVSVYVLFNQAVASEGEYSTVTWKTPTDEISERWFNGQTPVCPISLPEPTDVYQYRFTDVKAVGGDVTYMAKAYANFPVKANITLYTDFVYNAYIPVSVKDSVNSVSVAGAEFDLAKAEIFNIMGEDYYLVTCPIPASMGASSFELCLNMDGFGEEFVQKYTLSIPEYSKYVLSGKYDDNSKALMRTVLAYIDSCVDAVGGDASALEGIEGITDAKAPTDSVQGATPPTEFLSLFSSAQLSIGSSVNFRFNVNPGVTSGTAKFTFPVDGVNKTVTVTEEDWIEGGQTGYYYEVTMRARDLGRGITVNVNGKSYTYSLSNYVYYANNVLVEDEYANVRRIVNNLWAYYKASAGYTNTTPEIDVTVNGNSLLGYDIVAVSDAELVIANALADAIYQKTGTRPSVVNAQRAEHGCVYVTVVSGTAERDGTADFKVYESNSNLYVVCQYASFAEDGINTFIKDYISPLNVDYDFASGFMQCYNTDRVYYTDFGAKGDTVLSQNANGLYEANGTDDFVSIKFAHATANRFMRHTVYADPHKTFYISDTAPNGKNVERIDIKTNTVWTDAQIVIDDTNLYSTDAAPRYDYDVFRIISNHPSISITDTATLEAFAGAGPNTKKFDLGLGYDALLTVVNSTHRVYIRYGGNANSGGSQSELVVVDKYGNVEKGTELMLDYDKVTKIVAYRIDEDPLTLIGGKVITLAMRKDVVYIDSETGKTVEHDPYFQRGLAVNRSNTTVIGLEHKVYNEFTVEEQAAGLDGAAYSGFFGAGNATNVTFEDCIMCARRRFTKGTYGFSATNVNNVVLKNCTQSNFYKPGTNTISTVGSEYWGLGGTNYCKNMVYDGCMLTRFDAHAGLYNGKIINSTIAMVNLIGGGEMLIKDSVIMDTEVFTLRADYGSTWKGTVTISNTVLDTASSSPRICAMTWANHDFGYTCYFPNLILDNFRLREGNKSTVAIAHCGWDYTKNESGENLEYENNYGGFMNPIHLDVLPEHKLMDGTVETNVENKNPYVPPEFIKIYNNNAGVKYNFLQNYEFFANTKVYIFNNSYVIDSPLVPVKNKD